MVLASTPQHRVASSGYDNVDSECNTGGFGSVTAVFAPSFWNDAVVAAPVDTGLYTMICNETYKSTPNASIPPDLSGALAG